MSDVGHPWSRLRDSTARVGDAMAPFRAVSGSTTVAEFLDLALDERITVFLVEDMDGVPMGVVSFAAAARVPRERRPHVRVAHIMVALTDLAVAEPRELLSPVIRRMAMTRHPDLALVVRDGAPVGVVTVGSGDR